MMIAKTKIIEKMLSTVKTDKINSLLLVKKALREEAYEVCPFWISRALNCGASRAEIAAILRNPARHLEELLYHPQNYFRRVLS